VVVSGSTTLDGVTSWAVGDNAVFRNGVWIKRQGVSVTSWAGKIGTVEPVAADIPDFQATVSANTNVAANTLKRSYPSADEIKLAGIATNANNYTLPAPTTTAIGGVKRNEGAASQVVDGISATGDLEYTTLGDAAFKDTGTAAGEVAAGRGITTAPGVVGARASATGCRGC
jgi:hypothetical protein